MKKHEVVKNVFYLVLVSSLLASGYADAGVTTFGAMATKITSSFAGIVKLITAGSYVAGIGFSLGAIMKFKQHKDNPTQIPIGTPISMVFIAAALLFFPIVLQLSGMSIFGATTTATTGGVIWSGSGS